MIDDGGGGGWRMEDGGWRMEDGGWREGRMRIGDRWMAESRTTISAFIVRP
jgi:hypothetical protein